MGELIDAFKKSYQEQEYISNEVQRRTGEKLKTGFEILLSRYPKLNLIDPVKSWKDVEENIRIEDEYYSALKKLRKEMKKIIEKEIRQTAEKEFAELYNKKADTASESMVNSTTDLSSDDNDVSGSEEILWKDKSLNEADTKWKAIDIQYDDVPISPQKMEFFSKVAGVTYEGRQQYVKKCYAGQELDLIRDRMNTYDSNAIAVYAGDDQVGFIKKETAAKMAPKMDSGTSYKCYVSEVTGGGDKVYGLNIKICES